MSTTMRIITTMKRKNKQLFSLSSEFVPFEAFPLLNND